MDIAAFWREVDFYKRRWKTKRGESVMNDCAGGEPIGIFVGQYNNLLLRFCTINVQSDAFGTSVLIKLNI